DGKPLHGENIYNLVIRWGRLAGIPGPTVHRFRHTFAVSHLTPHPADLYHRQVLLGHESLEMVRRYAKIAEGERSLPGPSPVQLFGLDTGRRRRALDALRDTRRRYSR